jgi:hypothetical protein
MFIASQSQYVLCNKDFWSKVSVNELPEDKKEHKMTKLASPIVGDVIVPK